MKNKIKTTTEKKHERHCYHCDYKWMSKSVRPRYTCPWCSKMVLPRKDTK